MKTRRPAPQSRGGARPLGAALRALTLVLVIGVSAYLFDTLRQPESAPPPAAEQTIAQGASAVASQAAAPTAVADVTTERAPTGGYQKVELAQIAYGQAAEQVGLSAPKESRPRGPSSLGIAPDGTVYVADDANGRVQSYSSSGKYLGSIQVDDPIRDLAIGSGTDLFVLTSAGEVLAFDRATGQSRGRWEVAAAAAKSLGTLRISNGALEIESPQQVTYPLAVGSGSSLSELSSADQEKQAEKGGAAASKSYYSTSYRDGGHIYRQDSQGRVVQDVSLALQNVLSVVYLDEDASGSFYVQVESRNGDGAVGVEVWRFDMGGKSVAVVPLEPVTYLSMVRSVVVTADGSIYEAVPSKDSLRLIKWVAP